MHSKSSPKSQSHLSDLGSGDPALGSWTRTKSRPDKEHGGSSVKLGKKRAGKISSPLTFRIKNGVSGPSLKDLEKWQKAEDLRQLVRKAKLDLVGIKEGEKLARAMNELADHFNGRRGK